jgi:hypothetical protein
MNKDFKLLEFTEYVLPHGKKKSAAWNVPKDVYERAQLLKKYGLSFTRETLNTGDVVFYITDNVREVDVSTKILFNIDRNKPNADRNIVSEMIINFDLDNYLEQEDFEDQDADAAF